MSARVCPKCLRRGRHLTASSQQAVVDYFRCDSCGHVWAVDKLTDAKARDITIDLVKHADSN